MCVNIQYFPLYTGCEECMQTYEVECPTHKLVPVSDKIVFSRAWASLPPSLQIFRVGDKDSTGDKQLNNISVFILNTFLHFNISSFWIKVFPICITHPIKIHVFHATEIQCFCRILCVLSVAISVFPKLTLYGQL